MRDARDGRDERDGPDGRNELTLDMGNSKGIVANILKNKTAHIFGINIFSGLNMIMLIAKSHFSDAFYVILYIAVAVFVVSGIVLRQLEKKSYWVKINILIIWVIAAFVSMLIIALL